jgi:hypothetical protein
MGRDLELAGQISNIHSVYALVSLMAYPVLSWRCRRISWTNIEYSLGVALVSLMAYLVLSWQCHQISWIHTKYSLGVHVGQPDVLSSIVLVMPSD